VKSQRPIGLFGGLVISAKCHPRVYLIFPSSLNLKDEPAEMGSSHRLSLQLEESGGTSFPGLENRVEPLSGDRTVRFPQGSFPPPLPFVGG
jgi:hypothetical protein